MRSKYMSIDEHENVYVKNFDAIRAIQRYLVKRADKYLVRAALRATASSLLIGQRRRFRAWTTQTSIEVWRSFTPRCSAAFVTCVAPRRWGN